MNGNTRNPLRVALYSNENLVKPLIFGALAVAFVASAALAQNTPKKPAITGNAPLAPVGTYANYAFSKDVSRHQNNDYKYDEPGAMPATVDKTGADLHRMSEIHRRRGCCEFVECL